jgi:AcrR family transcriptional regulator
MAAKQPRKSGGGRTTSEVNRRAVVPAEVLDLAADLFLQNGYHQTRMQDIAEFFGVTHAALYYHFRNKQEILALLNVRFIEQLLGGAREVDNRGLPPHVALLEILRNHMLLVAQSPALAATLLEHDLEIPEEAYEHIAKLRREYNYLLVSLFDRGRGSGTLPDVDSRVAVSVLIGACNWVYRWYQPTGDRSPESLVDEAMRLLAAMVELDPISDGRIPGNHTMSTDNSVKSIGAVTSIQRTSRPRKGSGSSQPAPRKGNT